jgi:Avirulence protein
MRWPRWRLWSAPQRSERAARHGLISDNAQRTQETRVSEMNLDKAAAPYDHEEPPQDGEPAPNAVLDAAQRRADAMSYSGINGVMQLGEMLDLGVGITRAVPGMVRSVRGYLDDADADADAVASGRDKVEFKQVAPTVLAADVAGLGNVAYGAAAGIGDLASRVFTPGAGADRYQQANAQLHGKLEQGFERWVQSHGVDTDTATYRKAKAEAQIVGAVVGVGAATSKAPQAGATKAIAGSADDVIEYGSTKVNGEWVAKPVDPKYQVPTHEASSAPRPAYPSEQAAGQAQQLRIDGYSSSNAAGKVYSTRMEIASVDTARAIQQHIKAEGQPPSLMTIWGALSDARSITAAGMYSEAPGDGFGPGVSLTKEELWNTKIDEAIANPSHPNLFRMHRGSQDMPTQFEFDPYAQPIIGNEPPAAFDNQLRVPLSTFLGGQYAQYARRVVDRFTSDPSELLGHAQAPLSADDPYQHAATMTTRIDGEMVDLSHYSVRPATGQVTIYHTLPGDDFDRAMNHAEQLTHELLMQPHEKSAAMAKLAEVQWLLSHLCPNMRGSAGVTNAYVRSISKAIGIELPPAAKGVAPDMEALTLSKEEYVRNYASMFERKP